MPHFRHTEHTKTTKATKTTKTTKALKSTKITKTMKVAKATTDPMAGVKRTKSTATSRAGPGHDNMDGASPRRGAMWARHVPIAMPPRTKRCGHSVHEVHGVHGVQSGHGF